MRDRTQHHQKHHQKHHQHHRTKVNLISIAVLFIFYLLTPIKTYADQPTPTSLEIQRTTVGIKGKVLANSDYDVIIPIDTYYKVIFDSTGGSAVSMQFVKENCNAIEPAAPTRANYEFNFWVEKGTYEEFNFTTTPITHDITLKAVWTSTSPSPSDENKPNTDKEDTNSSEDTKDTTEDKEGSSDNKDENTETKEEDSDNKDKSTETNGEDSKSSENSDGLSNTSEENTDTNNENTDESTETTDEGNDNNDSNNGLINTPTNQSNQSKQSIETDPDIATNTETTDLINEIKATVLGVFKTIKTSITIVAKISLIGIMIWFIWFIILLNNTLVKIQAPSEDNNDQNQPDQPYQRNQRWKTIALKHIKKTIEQTVGDKRTIWSLSLPQNLLDDNKELKVKIPWSVYHRAEDINQANQTELHITIVNQDQSLPTPTMIYIITNETKEITIK